MKEFIGKKVLVTTSSWFYGKDGVQYRAIFGTLKGVHEAKDKMGFVPNRAHANWFFEIGTMIIMGCQVMYVQQVDEVNLKEVKDYTVEGGAFTPYIRPSTIYLADENNIKPINPIPNIVIGGSKITKRTDRPEFTGVFTRDNQKIHVGDKVDTVQGTVFEVIRLDLSGGGIKYALYDGNRPYDLEKWMSPNLWLVKT